MNRVILSTLAATLLSAGAALASDKCTSPMAEWQPRETLQTKLEAEGFKVNGIKVEDGCYEVYALDAKGKRMNALFEPKSLDRIADVNGESEDGEGADSDGDGDGN
jgi:hypothetical protein